jgi:hypothetical protein
MRMSMMLMPNVCLLTCLSTVMCFTVRVFLSLTLKTARFETRIVMRFGTIPRASKTSREMFDHWIFSLRNYEKK